MNKHALGVLEYSRVLDVLADRATSALGAARIRALEPLHHIEWMETEQRRVVAMRAIVTSDDGWHPEPIPDLTVSLARLRAIGSSWTGDELTRGGVLLRSSRITKEALGGTGPGAVVSAVLHPFAQPLVVAKRMEDDIAHAIDPDGSVRDEASGALRRLRRELRGAQGELVQLLERAMAKLEPHQRVPDMSVTMRNGRYVIPVRREGRVAIGGIVHDESATRGTVFVEPPAAIEFGNRIRALEAEEREEVERILAELTEAIRPLREEMVASLEALVSLDVLYARARFAEELGCAPADFVPAHEGFALKYARHPLLLARGGNVVPFDLEMGPSEHTLLLSGPNTGGKTVLLKAVGLISALAQSGIPAPVGPESRIPVFDDCFADIGDEQSIQASLSTFSAHLRNLGEILSGATSESLVLIDELGSGTDPAEGAALGGAILDALTARGVFTIATTHLGALKLLATENAGVVNGSLQFDAVALAPTYRLIKGIPGRSYGLSIARRLHLPEDVLQRAESRLSHGEQDVSALLGDLQERETKLAAREEAVEFDASRAAARLQRVEERDLALRESERAHERRAREEARRMLLEGRAEIERAVRELREQGAAATARDARRRVEELAAGHAAEIDRIDALERIDRPVRRAPVGAAGGVMAVGDTVEMETLDGRLGQIVELRNDQAIVAVGALKMTVPVSTLSAVARAPEPAAARAPSYAALPDVDVSTEIDLRGMRVDEMELALHRALDAAIGADLHVMRIIHGKGTGALRERVDELLRADRRVREHRPGAWNEGGTGVTVAELSLMITDESIERVREGADIVQIISEHVKLKRVGHSYRGPCPFHQGTGPNFTVDPVKKFYHCFVCKESGDAFTYLQKRLGMDFPDSIRYVAHKSGIVIEEVQRRADAQDPRQPLWDVNAMVADWFRTQLWDERAGEEARNYLAFRRVSREVADRFGLGFAPRDANAMREHLMALGVTEETLTAAGLLVLREESGELRPRFRNRLIFPILDASGNCTGFGGRLLGPGEPKYLNSSESPVYSKGKLLYGLHMAKHSIRREGRVMIVEGYFDVVRLVSAGFEWVVAPLGTALTEDQAALLPKYAKQAFLLYDNDMAGLKATFKSGDQLLRQKLSVQVVTLPEGEDPDSFVDKYGGEKLGEQLSQAVDIFERKLMELERGGYFADLHKKRVAIDKLLPTLRATADGVTREIYIARASEVSGVSREVLNGEVSQMAPRVATSHSSRQPVPPPPESSTVVERRTVERRVSSSPAPPKERQLVRILLHVRSLLEQAVETVGPDQLHDPALADIYRTLLSGEPDESVEVVAARLEPDSTARLSELLNDPIGEGEKYAEDFAALLAYFRAKPVKKELHEKQREMPIATPDQQDDILVNMQRLRNDKNAMGDRSFKGYGPARKT